MFAQRASNLPILTALSPSCFQADFTKSGKVFNLIAEKTSILGVFETEVIMLPYRISIEEGVLSSKAEFGLVVRSSADRFSYLEAPLPC